MKYAIHCKNKHLKWIAAFANTKEKAKAYIAKIKEDVTAEIIPIKVNEFPVYIIETGQNIFEFTSDFKTITKKIKAIKPKRNFDDAYFNYYILGKEFFTRPYGADRMGALDHVHITNDHLKTILKPEEKRCPRCDIYLRGKNIIRFNERDDNNYIKQCLNCGTSWNGKTGVEVDFEMVDNKSFNQKRKTWLSQKYNN